MASLQCEVKELLRADHPNPKVWMEDHLLMEELQRLQVPEDDQVLLENLMAAMRTLCTAWRMDKSDTGYTIRGAIGHECFEVDLEDLQLLVAVNPVRVDGVAVARSGGRSELVVRVLNCKQPISVRTNRVLITTQAKRRRMV